MKSNQYHQKSDPKRMGRHISPLRNLRESGIITVEMIDLDRIRREREMAEAEILAIEEESIARQEIFEKEAECFMTITELFYQCFRHFVEFGNLDDFIVTQKDAINAIYCKHILKDVLNDERLDYPEKVRTKVMSGLRALLNDDFFKTINKDEAEKT